MVQFMFTTLHLAKRIKESKGKSKTIAISGAIELTNFIENVFF